MPPKTIVGLTASVEPVVRTKRDLLLLRRVMKCMVYFGTEGAEQHHFANLAELAKEVIAFNCLFFSPQDAATIA